MDISEQDTSSMAKPALALLKLRRRPSLLGSHLEARKLKDAQALSPSERLLIALRLSDLCRELRRPCSPKR